jgi:sulfite reductase (ferredoxin)
MFQFFLEKPICQEMEFKMSFSSSDKDTALSYLHDLDLFQKIQTENVDLMLGGGLGSQPHHAELLSEFIPVNQIIQLQKVF